MSVHQEPATALPREHPDLQVGVYRGRIPLDFAKTASEPQLGPILGVSGKAHPSHVDPGKPFYAETEDPDLEEGERPLADLVGVQDHFTTPPARRR